jgi:exonuclease III
MSETQQQSVKIVSWNINGIRAILQKRALKEFINNHPDIEIILLQELKCQEDIFMSKEI